MALQTSIADANIQLMVQKFWSPMFMQELRDALLLGALVNREYSGEIKKPGDTVKVSVIQAPTGELKTVGTDADSFTTEQLNSLTVDVKADKRAVASFELEDLVLLQSQLGEKESEIRQALVYAVAKQINTHLYTKVAPIVANDLTIANLDASGLIQVRERAAKSKWPMDQKGWWGLMSPEYYSDILAAQTLTSKDYVDDAPVIGGQIANKRFGFNILEDNSLATQKAVFFHPDWLLMVMQTEPTFKISDLHSQKKFGYVMSVDVVFGAALSPEGDKKHILVEPA